MHAVEPQKLTQNPENPGSAQSQLKDLAKNSRLVRELRALLCAPAYARAAAEMADKLRGVDGAAAAAQRIIDFTNQNSERDVDADASTIAF